MTTTNPKPTRCQHCGSGRIREIDGRLVCWKCGEVQTEEENHDSQ